MLWKPGIAQGDNLSAIYADTQARSYNAANTLRKVSPRSSVMSQFLRVSVMRVACCVPTNKLDTPSTRIFELPD